MMKQGIIVEFNLRVERDQLAVGRHGQGIDLKQQAFFLKKEGGEAVDQTGALVHEGIRQRQAEDGAVGRGFG
jgi:hypothetical protein